MITYAPDPKTGQIVASQPQATQPSFNIPFLGKKTYNPGGSLFGSNAGGQGGTGNIKDLVNTLIAGMKDDKGFFQGGTQGRIFGRARDRMGRYVNPILGGFAQSGANISQDVTTGLSSLVQHLTGGGQPQLQGPTLPPQGLPQAQPTVVDVVGMIQQIIGNQQATGQGVIK